MEWSTPLLLPINNLLRQEITKLNYTFVPPGFEGDVRSVRVMQECLTKVIDQLGEQSSKAQGLNRVITTVEKFRNSPNYSLYLLKDEKAKGGAGEVIGMLKTGRKHLYLFDDHHKIFEVEPLCVLDFYIQNDRQRHGYGRKLFDYMLNDMKTSPHLLAVDGPSPKMEHFLIKNYGVKRLIRQTNNFAVSAQFFDNTVEEISKSAEPTPAYSPGVGRFTAPKPQSAIANVIHGGGSHHTSNGTSPEVALEEHVVAPEEVLETAEQVLEAVIVEPETVAAPEPPVEEEARSVERPCTLHVETAASALPSPAAPSPAGSTISRRDSQLTEKGFFDVKFYHNKLW